MKKLSNFKGLFNKLRGRKKKIFIRTLLMTVFVFGVNIYAWFVFSSTANVKVNANVMSWDIKFFENNVASENIVISVADLHPGMSTFEDNIVVTNSSDLDGNFSYEITGIKTLGRNSLPNEGNVIEFVRDTYPFSITMDADKDFLSSGDSLNFTINVDWPFEDNSKYFKLTNDYLYEPSFTYYTLSDNTYSPFEVTSSNFNDVKNSLYLEKDDADSFWGEYCSSYEETGNNACVVLNIKLIVEQVNS